MAQSKQSLFLMLSRPRGKKQKCLASRFDGSVDGILHSNDSSVSVTSIQAFVNGERSAPVSLVGDKWKWEASLSRPRVSEKYPTIAKVPRDYFLVVIIAALENGRTAASMLLID